MRLSAELDRLVSGLPDGEGMPRARVPRDAYALARVRALQMEIDQARASLDRRAKLLDAAETGVWIAAAAGAAATAMLVTL